MQKETRVQREKTVLVEILVPKGQRELKDQRAAVVFQVHPGHPDQQDQRENEVPPDCLDMLVNQEKREILEPLEQGDETDQKGFGEIPDLQGHREREEHGVHVVNEARQEHRAPQGQREALVSLVYQVTEETRALQDPRGTEDSQALVDQWVYQEKQVYLDIRDLAERRELKEKSGQQAPQECLEGGVP